MEAELTPARSRKAHAVRRGALFLLRPGDADLQAFGRRPDITTLRQPHPVPWLRAWWEHHVLYDPEQAAHCLDPVHLRRALGPGASMLTPSLLAKAEAALWTRQVIELTADRADLPDRVVARKPRPEGPDLLLDGTISPSYVRRIPRTQETRWPDRKQEPPDLVEEVLQVPHLVAEGLQHVGAADDLGLATAVPPALQRAYLRWAAYTWPPTRLERARANVRASPATRRTTG